MNKVGAGLVLVGSKTQVLLEQIGAGLILLASDIRLVALLFSSGVFDAVRYIPEAIESSKHVQKKHLKWLFGVNAVALIVVWTISWSIDFGLSYFSSSYVTALRYFIYFLSLVFLIPTWIAAIGINIWLNNKIVSATAGRVRVIGGPARPAQSRPEMPFFAELAAEITGMFDEILTVSLVNLTMTIISGLTPLIPVFGRTISFVQTAMIYGHTCFETRLAMQKLTPKDRILFVDKHWLYFLGYGMPLTVLTFFLPFFISTGLYSFCLPFCAIMSMYANPVRAPLGRTRIPERISYASEASLIVSWLKEVYYKLKKWWQADQTVAPAPSQRPLDKVESPKAERRDTNGPHEIAPLPNPSIAPLVRNLSIAPLSPSLVRRQNSAGIAPFTDGDAPDVGVIHNTQARPSVVPTPNISNWMPMPVIVQPSIVGAGLPPVALSVNSMSSLPDPTPIQLVAGSLNHEEESDAVKLPHVSDAADAPNTTGTTEQAGEPPIVMPVIMADPSLIPVTSVYSNSIAIQVMGATQDLQS